VTSHFFVFVLTETVTGTFIPSKSEVRSFMALIISIMFTPNGPSAGPNGGPAEACPPVTNAEMDWVSDIF
jgi:hypothetical protein